MIGRFLIFALVFVTSTQGYQKFHNRLYKEILTKDANKNIIFSPFSIQLCLGLARLGASGVTADEISQVIGSNFDTKNLSQALTNLNQQDVLKVANKVYAKSGYELNPSYLTSVRDDLKSEVDLIDFGKSTEAAKTMNDWVEEQTDHKIKEVINPGVLNDETMLVLINAVYFKALWKHQFKSLTNQTFTDYDGASKEVEFMKKMERFKFVHSDELHARVVKLAYRDTNIAMYLVIPDEVTGLKDVEQHLDEIDFKEIDSRMTENFISLYLPKLEMNYDISLNNPLYQLGMKSAFGSSADFTNVYTSKDHLQISKAIHKAFIKMDQKGTEAGAVTVFSIQRKSGVLEPHIVVKADRPFMLAIVSEDIESPLFMGSVKFM